MKFHLVDRIESLHVGQSITTIKALSLAEEYLADHFPTFPVLPGVLMLEALVQSAAWLVRATQGFSKSIIVLSAARNIRYANFVTPGGILRCQVEAMEIGETTAKFKGTGVVDDQQAVTGRLELACFNLAQRDPKLAGADAAIVAQLRGQFKLVGGEDLLSR